MAALPLTARKNIKEYEPKRDEYLAVIKAATGRDFTVDLDWAAWNEATTASGRANVGEIVYSWYLEGLSNNVKSILADDMSKEAFNEAVTNTTIRFEFEGERGYGTASIKNGQLVISVPKSNFACNLSEVGNNIEKIL